MRPQGIIIDVTAADRARLEAVVADRNSPQKHVWRAAIVLATADGLGTNAVMRRTGKSKTVVWRWQERFASDGVDGLLRDKTRPSRIAPFGPKVGERIVALTLADPPGETDPPPVEWSALRYGLRADRGRIRWERSGTSLRRSLPSCGRWMCWSRRVGAWRTRSARSA